MSYLQGKFSIREKMLKMIWLKYRKGFFGELADIEKNELFLIEYLVNTYPVFMGHLD